MIARKETKTITMKPDLEEPPEERIGQQKKPDIGQFRLQVDRQTKQSYATFEAAEQAGITIKKKHPAPSGGGVRSRGKREQDHRGAESRSRVAGAKTVIVREIRSS